MRPSTTRAAVPLLAFAATVALAVIAVIAGFGATARAAGSTPTPPLTLTPTPPPRLGSDVVPTRYEPALTLTPSADRFSGTIRISLDVRRPSALVWLHTTALTIRRARFTVGGATSDARIVPGDADATGFAPARPLPPGPATLTIDYAGEVTRNTSTGMFHQQEAGQWYLYTKLEPIHARRVFPSFDEPAFKAPWQLRLDIPADQRAVSNTPISATRELGRGRLEVTFAATPPLPTYLVALAVGPFDFADAGRAGGKQTPIRIVVPHGRAADARQAVAWSARILAELERYFGTPYPYDKLDLVSIPLAPGAMENVGLVTFAQQILIARPEDESAQFSRRLARIATHELAHQWFGDLVTTAWWDDIWLNEAFATWMTGKVLAAWQPGWRYAEDEAHAADEAMDEDGLASSRRIRQTIGGKDDIFNAFDGITYDKGAAVIGMFERWLGADRFRDGIRRYLARYAFGNATADQFLATVAEAADASRPLVAPFQSFLDQPGVPVVAVTLQCEHKKAPVLQLAQKRSSPLGAAASAPRTWQIPVCARWTDGRGQRGEACTLLSAPSGTLVLGGAAGCPAWVDANPARGYYRVAYDARLRQKLARDRARAFDPAARLGLIDDVAALARAGQVPFAELLELAAALAPDPSRHVAAAAMDAVDDVRDLELVPATLAPAYARFVRAAFGPRLQALGLAARAGDSDDDKLLRARLIALLADAGADAAVRSAAVARVRAWLADPAALDADLVAPLLGAAALGGDATLYDALLAEARRTPQRLRRQQLLDGVARFRPPELVQRSLALLVAPDFDFREASVLLARPQTEPALRPLIYDFVKEHFDALVARAPRDYGAQLSRTGSGLCDAEHRADVERFFGARAPRYHGGPRLLAQTLERIDVCLALHARAGADVAAFLGRH